MTKKLFVILGPTAIGKTELSIEIAQRINSEIFSCDSRQFFKELNIGVAKPDVNQLNTVKHHFIGHISVTQHYSISKYEQDFLALSSEYFKKNNIAILCGGSGLYIDAVCYGVDEMPDHDPKIREEVNVFLKTYGLEKLKQEVKKIDPEYYNSVDKNNPQRLLRALEIYKQTGKKFSEYRKRNIPKRDFEIIKIGIELEREKLYQKANLRVDKMIVAGLIDEVKSLSVYKELIPLKTIGYKEIFDYFDNKINLETAIEQIKRNTRHYIRRQMTWFRRYNDIKWFNVEQKNDIMCYIEKSL
ncbi:MAG: tRNA (adenosine(37)-N6)-dimethylallyltransferase MiaA [Bacteroidales bacterium]|jgi:tRNA dimethylallyltransferase|nr:tRNA (adenosine(37)-N6)-dimethylallyltransferase MiaA [Bacteroidales bacterium]HOL97499.1 tRNA (adenosine(37)-N6)-dimethylallyltransferase MiaA [Bacteroidales bacterium]HOM35767.1 tRNA (adenosine(37)-N6)-dimethylallyltransferase MiaA [Bacteroidales bacterium]HPD23015.1 tRNA (adenosine(37)-N6)-dimethylallyltransferase MiaA [Bacteroidales bacterium]HRS98854.1 tRNA (adenosine(37)-N6)-dimethylallyltransferase MiaA [Bacteroidales bacterium]